jgi:hypothetical protein
VFEWGPAVVLRSSIRERGAAVVNCKVWCDLDHAWSLGRNILVFRKFLLQQVKLLRLRSRPGVFDCSVVKWLLYGMLETCRINSVFFLLIVELLWVYLYYFLSGLLSLLCFCDWVNIACVNEPECGRKSFHLRLVRFLISLDWLLKIGVFYVPIDGTNCPMMWSLSFTAVGPFFFCNRWAGMQMWVLIKCSVLIMCSPQLRLLIWFSFIRLSKIWLVVKRALIFEEVSVLGGLGPDRQEVLADTGLNSLNVFLCWVWCHSPIYNLGSFSLDLTFTCRLLLVWLSLGWHITPLAYLFETLANDKNWSLLDRVTFCQLKSVGNSLGANFKRSAQMRVFLTYLNSNLIIIG